MELPFKTSSSLAIELIELKESNHNKNINKDDETKTNFVDLSNDNYDNNEMFITNRSPSLLKKKKTSKRVILNVGGIRHEVMWKTLEKFPASRLGRISYCKNTSELLNLCDDVFGNEIYFDKHPSCFTSVINYYRTGKLHILENVCVLSFHGSFI
jgi:hypothetical protein